MATRKEACGRGKIHKPTDKQREQVKAMSSVGIPIKQIAMVLDMHHDTLMKHYRRELDTAATIANAQVGGHLFKKCMAGDTSALIFWAKTRMRWKETTGIELTGEDGSPLLVQVLDDVK